MNNNLKKLINFDRIRIYKIIEMFQFSLILMILAVLLSRFISYLFPSNEEYLNKKTKLILYLEVIIISFLYVILTFYVLKFVKIIPSIVHIFDKKFIPYTTLHYAIDIIFIVIFVKINNSLGSRLKKLELIDF